MITVAYIEVNIQKTEIVVFIKGGRLSYDDHCFYGDQCLCTADTFLYLGIFFHLLVNCHKLNVHLLNKL